MPNTLQSQDHLANPSTRQNDRDTSAAHDVSSPAAISPTRQNALFHSIASWFAPHLHGSLEFAATPSSPHESSTPQNTESLLVKCQPYKFLPHLTQCLLTL